MANSVATTGICLYALAAREEAVLKRVISFSSTQGRDYVLAGVEQANLLVVSDDTAVDPAQLNPAGCLIIRIADAGSTQMYDVLMPRPLLVTKVMRTLDDAKAMLSAEAMPEASSVSAPVAAASADSTAPKAAPLVSATSVPAPAPSVDNASSGIAPIEPVKPSPAPQPVEPVAPKPKPAMSLYAQILGGGTGAEQAASQSSLAKPVAEPTEETPPQTPPQTANERVAEPSKPVLANDTQSAVSETDKQADKVVPADTQTPPADSVTATMQDTNHLALVVDDSASIRKQLELELRTAGIAAEFAETGEEALEKVAAKRYDLIFLDIVMPGIDGYETCRQMRLRAELKKTPVIMLSAKTSPLDEVQGVIAGASTYLTKPVKSDQFQQTLKRVSMWLDNFQVSA